MKHDPVIVVRDPAYDAEAQECNCHPGSHTPTFRVIELGNEQSAHSVRLCVQGFDELSGHVLDVLMRGVPMVRIYRPQENRIFDVIERRQEVEAP